MEAGLSPQATPVCCQLACPAILEMLPVREDYSRDWAAYPGRLSSTAELGTDSVPSSDVLESVPGLCFMF